MGYVWMMVTVTAVISLLVTPTAACMKKEEPHPEVTPNPVSTAKPGHVVTVCSSGDSYYMKCLNNGNCSVEINTDTGSRQSYCQCTKDYTGARCETRVRSAPLATGSVYAVVGVSVFLFVIVVILIAVIIWIKKKQSGQSSSSSPQHGVSSNGTELHAAAHQNGEAPSTEDSGLMSTEPSAA